MTSAAACFKPNIVELAEARLLAIACMLLAPAVAQWSQAHAVSADAVVANMPAQVAAAADACGKCGGEYGSIDEAEAIRWIACDSCNQWFHGACAGMADVSIRNC